MPASMPAGGPESPNILAASSSTTALSSPSLLPKCHEIDPRLMPERSAISMKVVLRNPCSAKSIAAVEIRMPRLSKLVWARRLATTAGYQPSGSLGVLLKRYQPSARSAIYMVTSVVHADHHRRWRESTDVRPHCTAS